MDFYSTKFKERKPEETIEIIKNFFESKGYQINIIQNISSEIETWSNYINISMDGIEFQGACGKGMTETLALASGYAELYERFCNKMPTINNLLIMNKSIEISKEENGYYLHPNEKQLSYNDIIQDEIVKLHFSQVIKNPKNQKEYINIICNNQPIGIPYYGFNVNDIKYYDPRIIAKIISSTGMAAGNTIEEALNQGLSEIFERYVYEKIFTNRQEKYYQLDINAIKNEELKNKALYLKNKYDFYIFDLSYNYNVPVILSALISKKTYNILFNIGCFPCFDIALERTLTELYQGEKEWDSKVVNRYQSPWEDKNWDFTQTHLGHSYLACYHIPEEMFTKNIVVQHPSEIFLVNNNYTNQEINNYYKELANKMKIQFYYADNSLCDEMKAIHIFSNNFLPITGRQYACNKFNELQQERLFDYFKNYYNLSLELNKIETKKNLFDFINQAFIIDTNVSDIKNFITYLVALNQMDYFIPYSQKDNCENTLWLIKGIYNKVDIVELAGDCRESFYYNTLKKYLSLILYRNCENETGREYKNFLKFLDNKYTEEDFNNYNNSLYQIQKIFIEPFQQEIKSERFKKICKSLIARNQEAII